MENEALVEKVRELVVPLLASRRAELVELTCRSEGARVILRFLVDTARGVTMGDLQSLNRAIGDLLDEQAAIPSAYLLEVSSPGLDRSLKVQADFERVLGRRLRVMTTTAILSKREHSGELLSAGEDAILVRVDSGEKVRIPLGEILKAVQEIRL